jgi:hypothetical protein
VLRVIIRRRLKDRESFLAYEEMETLDVACPELERVLREGTTGDQYGYDWREIAGIEVLQDSTEAPRE